MKLLSKLAIVLFLAPIANIALAMPDAACKGEVEKNCPGMKPGEGLFKCINEKMSSFSATCQEKFKEKKAQMAGGHHAGHKECEADYEKFCKSVQPGEGRIIKCMKDNEANLSAECKAKMAAKAGQWKKHP